MSVNQILLGEAKGRLAGVFVSVNMKPLNMPLRGAFNGVCSWIQRKLKRKQALHYS